MSIYRIVNMDNISRGKFGRVPDPPEPPDNDARNCEKCAHYKVQGITSKDHVPYFGCERWNCEFELKEEE